MHTLLLNTKKYAQQLLLLARFKKSRASFCNCSSMRAISFLERGSARASLIAMQFFLLWDVLFGGDTDDDDAVMCDVMKK